jgi:TonB-dependent SusC/RagA subfamily outer membrane receptor
MKKSILLTILLCLSGLAAEAQTRQIRGLVTSSEDRSSLPGVSVSQVGANKGTSTGLDGNYTLDITGKNVQLKFQFIGYEPQTITITEENVYDVVLEISRTALDEVVVTAGGIFRARREQGYSTTKITNTELTAGKSPSLAGGLTAKIPGLQINAITAGVDPNYRLVLRGNRSITGNNQALIVVDNAVVSNDFLNSLNPEDIENVQVLNGASGATLYGSEASNGVLLVTTKKGAKGKPQIKVSHTTTWEQVSFFPKLQSRFGQGSTADGQVFDPIENQQYGPVFDGSLRKLGYPLENGDQQEVTYEARNDRNEFWETGIHNQTDLSFGFGTDNSTLVAPAID